MWIRFIDPEDLTHELSPPSELDSDDFTEDEADWRTPALAPDTKALM
jgi:hypothetical protein